MNHVETKYLKFLQKYLNKACFGNKLKNIPVRIRSLKREDGAIGFFEWRDGKPYQICIEKGQTYMHRHFILLHEMLHQYEYVTGRADVEKELHHTQKFKNKLRMLHKRLGWKPPPAWSMKW